MSSCASPSRRYHLLPPAGPGPIINCKGGSSHTGSTAMMVSAHETTLLRYVHVAMTLTRLDGSTTGCVWRPSLVDRPMPST